MELHITGPSIETTLQLDQPAAQELQIDVVGAPGPPADNLRTMGVVFHDQDAMKVRPNFASVTWIGSIEPQNRALHDLWVDTST
jgi:hypothetical protein